MTDLTMSQFASKDDLVAAQAARIAELESQLEAIGAGGVEPLRKQGGQVLIDFDQVGTAGPFAVVDGRVHLPGETMMDLARMLKPTIDAMEAAPQAVQAAAPMFWVRLLRDGLYEGPVHNNSASGKLLRDEKPGEWHPLYLHAAPAHPAEGVANEDEAFEKWWSTPHVWGLGHKAAQRSAFAAGVAHAAATQPAAQGGA